MYYEFANYVGGNRSGENLPCMEIESLDGSVVVAVPDSDLTELIAVRDYVTQFDGTSASARFDNGERTLDARIAIVRSVYAGFQARQAELIELVHKIHGTPRNYLVDSCTKLRKWVDGLDLFVQEVSQFSLAQGGVPFGQRTVLTPYALVSAGNFEIYESFYLLAQTILSGTHLIIRPSAYDIATHVIFDVLAQQGVADVGQKLTWDSSRQPGLIRHFLRFVSGASIFGGDEQIRSILVTSILERHAGGYIEERVIEDLSRGKKVRAYGSGNAMLVVMDNPKEAANHFYYAKVCAKGNKCWVPDGAIVLHQHVDAFCERLIELDQGNQENTPRFPLTEIEAMSAYIDRTVGRLDYGTYYEGEQSVGIMLCKNLQPDSPFFAREVTFPAAGIIGVDGVDEAVGALNEIIAQRDQTAYLSLGFFGSEAVFKQIQVQIASEAYHANESLVVDLMEPHQGSYFMLDPTAN